MSAHLYEKGEEVESLYTLPVFYKKSAERKSPKKYCLVLLETSDLLAYGVYLSMTPVTPVTF